MTRPRSHVLPRRARAACRITWTLTSLVVVQTLVCAVSMAPVVLVWQALFPAAGSHPSAQWAFVSVAVAPSYLLFALTLMVVSPITLRLFRWYTPPDARMSIANADWALMRWVRYGASIHLPRVVAGTVFRGTPIWTAHLRLCGARLGKRTYVNSLAVSDYNLIECGDDVIIGGAVQLSGHTVEAGIVKTARVRIGDNVTIGLGSVIEIGVEIGPRAQVGALSFVPKFTKLEGGVTYAGAPAVPLERPAAGRSRAPASGPRLQS